MDGWMDVGTILKKILNTWDMKIQTGFIGFSIGYKNELSYF